MSIWPLGSARSARLSGDLDAGREEASGEDARDRAGDLTAMPFHAADLGTDSMNAELAASNAARISRELAEIVPWARTCREAGA